LSARLVASWLSRQLQRQGRQHWICRCVQPRSLVLKLAGTVRAGGGLHCRSGRGWVCKVGAATNPCLWQFIT
jgi:hypothetical protein